MAAKFGTSGLRGLAMELVGGTTRLHVRAFVRYIQARKLARRGGVVCVAYDFRDSSEALLQDALAALAQEGMKAIVFGAVPTPALALEAMRRKAGAIMITGSHIPADRNGLKFYLPQGEISKRDEKAISAGVVKLQASAKWAKPHGEAKPEVQLEKPDAFVARCFDAFSGQPLKGLRVGVYQHSTVARDMLVDVLRHAGAEAMALGRSASFIPVDTEAVSEATQALVTGWCKAGRFDAIVSADGDGDRPLICDERGQILRGDFIGMITARFLGAKTVVTPITSNSGIDAHLSRRSIRTKVGSPYVIAGMKKAKRAGAKAIVGFEANGGFFTLSPFKLNGSLLAPLPTRDCFLPILAVLSFAARERLKLSSLAEKYPLPVALAGRLENYPLATSAALMARLKKSPFAARDFLAPLGSASRIDKTDGLRCTLRGDAIVHLRPSGNAPEFRCYVEAAKQAEAEQLLQAALQLIKDFQP
jgi:phosphomannomutase